MNNRRFDLPPSAVVSFPALYSYAEYFQRFSLWFLPGWDHRWLVTQCYQESNYVASTVSPVGVRGIWSACAANWPSYITPDPGTSSKPKVAATISATGKPTRPVYPSHRLSRWVNHHLWPMYSVPVPATFGEVQRYFWIRHKKTHTRWVFLCLITPRGGWKPAISVASVYKSIPRCY